MSRRRISDRRASSSRSAEPSKTFLRPREPRTPRPPAGRARPDAHRRTRRCHTDLAAGGKRPRPDARGGRPPMGVDRADGQQRRGTRTARARSSSAKPASFEMPERSRSCRRISLAWRWTGRGMETSRAPDSSSPRASTVARQPGASSLVRGAQALLDGRQGSRRLRADREPRSNTPPHGGGTAVRVAQWAASVLYNGLARYDEAAAAARQVTANTSIPIRRCGRSPSSSRQRHA